ncbi:MAG: alpha-L-fucosidase [Prevotellaceae bacterium]|jgi:alpha-L-fucosidase|nr:alpha-L-fucosidase [Prevotellaceae bacterium]
MKKILLTAMLAMLSLSISAQANYVPSKENLEARKFLEEARFGMFVHWGASSVLSDGEWVMNNRNIKVGDYSRLINFFDPQDFDPVAWVSMAKGAGMKYIIFVSRHHDSFSNWDTKQSEWKITETRYGKDVIKLLAEECKKQDMKLGFYYSTLDWYRSDYQWETGRTGKGTGRAGKSDWPAYINFMKAQLTELLTEYGPVFAIWFDGHWDQTDHENRTDPTSKVNWHYDEIYSLIHSLQPQCLVANNHHLPPFPGEDYQIFERDLPGENKSGLSGQSVSEKLPLETCETINDSWGYRITDNKYKSTKQLVHTLVRAAGYGANLLLNVGPMPNGEIQSECVERLVGVGAWLEKYGKTVYGTQAGFVNPQSWGAITRRDKSYFIHILQKESEELTLDFPVKIKEAKWLNSTTKAEWKQEAKTNKLTLKLNVPEDEIDTILEITVK